MDRTAWIAVTLCVAGLVLWQVYVFKQVPPPRPAMAAGASATPSVDFSPSPAPVTSAPSPAASVSASATPAPAPVVPAYALVTETLRNADVELHLTNRGGGIAEAVLLNHTAEGGKRVTLNSEDHPPIGAILENPAMPVLPEYQMRREGEAVIFEHSVPGGLTIRKKIFFQPSEDKKDKYSVQLDIEIRNDGATTYENPGYYLSLGSAVPSHPDDYPSFSRLMWYTGKLKGIDVGWFTGGSGFLGMGQRAPQQFYQENIPGGAQWGAVTNQFFATLGAPLNGRASSVWGRRFEVPGAPNTKVAGMEGAIGLPPIKLEPGKSYTASFEIYSGPKLYHRLATLSHNEAEIMDFGIFKIVCQALLNALNSLHSITGNYATAILALTVIVKMILWPLQNKANRTARQMAVLGPKMQELREKYKDDPTRMNQEVMKLYKEYGINPVGGCLPMLIQIPIFFGLFTMLRQAVELRNSTFLWIHDLSQPDTVARLALAGWDLKINLLPILMAVTNVWLMQITPKSGDPTQQRIMMFMPIIFVVFCYNFAAALALYYTTQNLLTILQLYLNKRQPMPKLEKIAPAGKKRR